jgi:hypothetical protein
MNSRMGLVVLGLLFVAGLATPLTLFKRGGGALAPQAKQARDGQGVGGGEGSSQTAPAGSSERRAKTRAAPANSALARLQKWLGQPGRWPISYQESELRRLVKALGKEELPQAWALRTGLKPQGLREKFCGLLMSRWAAVDRPAALAAALAIPEKAERGMSLTEVVSVWGENEPSAAAAWINSYYLASERASKLMLVFYACGHSNPTAARDLWQQLPPGILRDDAVMTFIQELARQDRDAAVGCLNGIQSAYGRKDARDSILFDWARTEPAAALAWALEQPRLQDRDDVARVVIYRVLQQDPARAASLVGALSATTLAHDADVVSEVAGQWATRDANAAAAWSQQLPAGPPRDRALAEVGSRWAEQDAPGAAAFAKGLADSGEQAKWLGQVAQVWSAYDAKAALAWLGTVPEGPTRDAVVAGFGDGLAIWKPEEAARFAASLPAGELQTETTLKVVTRWVRDDPSAAAAWVSAFPTGPARERAIAELVKQWRREDRTAADAWAQQNAPSLQPQVSSQ